MEKEKKEILYCSDCWAEITDDNYYTTADGDIICEDCYFNDYFVCGCCGEIHSNDEIVRVEDNEDAYYCESCAQTELYHCDDCGSYFESCDSLITTHDERDICESCYDDYFTCAECGEVYHNDDANYCEEDGEYYCPDCIAQFESNTIKSYHAHKGSYKKHKTQKDKNISPLYFGFELEVENKKNNCYNDDMTEIIYNIMGDLVVFEHDGSLNNGFEIISQPMTFNYIIENKNIIDKMLQKLRENGFASHDTTTCGLHVHLSRDYFTETQIDKMNLLIEKNKKELLKFSRRNIEQQCHWSKFLTDENTPLNGLNIKYIKDNKKTYDRYYALNLTNRETIEFRLFKGTLKTETFFASLQLLYNMARIAKTKSIKDIENMKFKDLIENGFFKKELKNYCLEKNIIESEVQ